MRIVNIFKGDKVIWMVFFFLCIISIVEVYSASSRLTFASGNYLSPVFKHVCMLGLGLVAMIMTVHMKCKYFKVFTPFALFISFALLLYLFLFGSMVNGSRRWVELPLIGIQFQPSEIAKGAVVLAVAQILSAMQTDKGADPKAFNYILIVCAFIVPFIGIENFSTACLLCVVVLMMMLIGRVKMRQIGILIGTCVIIISLSLGAVMSCGNDLNKPAGMAKEHVELARLQKEKKGNGFSEKVLHRCDTWKTRIVKYLYMNNNREKIKPEDIDLDKDAQVAHANIAIASSNISGKGPGNSEERDFLSQAFSDFIYAIIIEETGIFGAFIVAMLYVVLLFRTGRIAGRCANNFPALLAMGLAMMLVTQALFNMCVAVGIAPVTGQPLPFVSMGGTSTIINCIYIGVILSVSRTAETRDELKTPTPTTAAAA